MQKYSGGCHCGKVRYEVEADLSTVIECNCSHCHAKGLLLTFVPASQFTFMQGEDELAEYRFNKNLIAHLFCRTCGVQPIGRATGKDGAPRVALNVRCLDNVDIKSLKLTPFNGKDI